MFKINVMMRFEKPGEVTVRAWREVLRNAMTEVALYWHRVMAPRHFRDDARGRYGYLPRTKKYEKGRQKKGKPDLIFSGATYRAVVQGTPQIRAFPTRANLHYDTEDYIQMHPVGSSKMPNLGQEITRVMPDEGIELGRMAAASVEQGIQRLMEHEWFRRE